jgi:hypothetical protein
MLIEAPFKNGDVVTLKLTSGEELVGKLEEEKTDSYKIKTPLTLIMNQQGLGLQQYLFTGDPEKAYEFKKDKVITITKTIKQFADVYQQQTSNIVMAPAGLGNALKTK